MFFHQSAEVSNYDVLFGRDGSLASANHVGNNRFEVFLELHRKEFFRAKSQQERDVTVDRIINTVCRQCVPNGRFLERNGDQWAILSSDKATRERIHQALMMGVDTENHKRLTRHVTEESTQRNEGGPKRPRRGSLHRLRRSMSESMVSSCEFSLSSMTMEIEEEPAASIDRNPTWESERGSFPGPPMTPAAPILSTVSNGPVSQQMDVILSANGVSLDPQPTLVGNNRFRVLLTMHSKSLNMEETATELVRTVTTHWKGRFLKATSDFPQAALQELSTSESTAFVATLLRQQQAAAPAAPPPQQAATSATPPPQQAASSASASLFGVFNPAEIRNMRKAAVKELKERKQKKQVANKMIGRLLPLSNDGTLPSSFNSFQNFMSNKR